MQVIHKKAKGSIPSCTSQLSSPSRPVTPFHTYTTSTLPSTHTTHQLQRPLLALPALLHVDDGQRGQGVLQRTKKRDRGGCVCVWGGATTTIGEGGGEATMTQGVGGRRTRRQQSVQWYRGGEATMTQGGEGRRIRRQQSVQWYLWADLSLRIPLCRSQWI